MISTHKHLLYIGLLWVFGIWPKASLFAQAVSSASDSFSNAIELFHAGLYQRAYEQFKAFETANPNHPNAAEARYYQAESLLALGRTEEAAPLYAHFMERYPGHPLGNPAQMTLGRYFFEQQLYEKARVAFGTVFQRQATQSLAAEGLYWMALCSQKLKETDIAQEYFDLLLRRYPNTAYAPQALYMMGKTELERQNFQAASARFDQLASQYPNAPEAQWVSLASLEANFELGRYDRVIGEGERKLPNLKGRDLERALLILGESANQINDYSRAQYYFNQLSRSFPNSPYMRYANFGMGWNYLQGKQYPQATRYFEEVTLGFRDQLAHKAMYYNGVSLLLSGDISGAKDKFQRVVEGWPSGDFTDQALFELGMLAYRQQNWEDAARLFNQVTTQFPKSSNIGDAYLLLGESFAMLGDVNRANTAFEYALQQPNLSEQARNQLNFRKGWLLYQSKDYANAQAAFGEAFRTTNAGDALFWTAETMIQQGNYAEAERLLTQYLTNYKNDPNVNNANYLLGWLYYSTQRYPNAVQAFERFLANFRDAGNQQSYRTDAQLRLGDSYFAMKKFDEAVAAYRKVGNQGTIYALYQIGQSYMNAGQYADAINAFRRLVGNYPNSEWASESLYSVGTILLQQQQYDQAINEYFNVIRFYGNSPEAAKAQYGIGDAYFNQNRYSEAISAYREVLTRYPQSPVVADALSGIQQAYSASGQPTGADALVDQFLRNNPNSPVTDQVRFQQAELQFQNGDYQRALQGFQYFLQAANTPDLTPAATYYVGACYAQLRDPRNAEQYLLLAISRYPNTPAATEATRLLGSLYLANARPQEALTQFRRLETLATDDAEMLAEAIFGQAQAVLAQGDANSGRQLLERVVSQFPNTDQATMAQLRLAAVFAQNNNVNGALDLYRRIAQTQEGAYGAEAQFRYGSLLLQQNRAQEALAAFQAIPQRFQDALDWIAQSYLGEGRAYKALGQRSAAAQAYDKVIAEFPNTSFAQTARTEKATL